MTNRLQSLNVYQARALSIEASRRVLHLWERAFPADRTIVQSLEVTEAFLKGSATAADVANVRKAAHQSMTSVPTGIGYIAAQQAGYAAYAAAHPDAHKGANQALKRALNAVKYSRQSEATWQTARIQTIASAGILATEEFEEQESFQPASSAFVPPQSIPGVELHG